MIEEEVTWEDDQRSFEIKYKPGDEVVDPEHGRGEIVEAVLTLRITSSPVAKLTIVYSCEFPDGATVEYDSYSIVNHVREQPKEETIN